MKNQPGIDEPGPENRSAAAPGISQNVLADSDDGPPWDRGMSSTRDAGPEVNSNADGMQKEVKNG